MNKDKETLDALAEEAELWAKGHLSPHDLVPAPEATPRAKESETISLRMPAKQLFLLREFARRSGIGYQVLIKRWLDDRLREEFGKLRSFHLDASQIPVAEPAAAAGDLTHRILRSGEVKVHAPQIVRSAASFLASPDSTQTRAS